MLKIRLQRAGRRNLPFYRIVVAEDRDPVKGKYVELLGHYNPLSNPKILECKEERVQHWISVGAKPSQTVAGLLVKKGMKDLAKFIEEREQKPSKKEVEAQKKAEEEAAAKAAAEEEAKAAAEAPAEEAASEEKIEAAPAEEVKEETPAEEPVSEETSKTEEGKEETPAEEPQSEESPEEEKKEDEAK